MTRFSRRGVLGGAAALAAGPALAQSPPAPARPKVLLTTGAGPITLEIAVDKAPITGANFLRYVDARRYDSSQIYRAMKITPEPLNGLVQGGLGGLPREVFPPIAHEPTTQTGLKHLDGAVSLARGDPGTGQSEFFMCVGAVPSLDADPSQPGDNLGYAVFAQVVDGMDVVRRILLSPVSAAGEGAMKGQMLSPPIPILTARRV